MIGAIVSKELARVTKGCVGGVLTAGMWGDRLHSRGPVRFLIRANPETARSGLQGSVEKRWGKGTYAYKHISKGDKDLFLFFC